MTFISYWLTTLVSLHPRESKITSPPQKSVKYGLNYILYYQFCCYQNLTNLKSCDTILANVVIDVVYTEYVYDWYLYSISYFLNIFYMAYSNNNSSSRFSNRSNSSSRYNNNSSSNSSFGSRSRFGGTGGGGRYGRRKSGPKQLDQSLFVKVAKPTPAAEVVISHTFADFGFADWIQQALTAKGMITPTPIQDQSIKPIMEGKDIIGLAATGTGKTLAFLLPLLHNMTLDSKKSAVILAPTRELALQIEQELHKITNRGQNIYSTVCIGGTPIRKQMFRLSRHNQFIIATPGRFKDLINRKAIDMSTFSTVVLDEVDRMLDMGFIDEIRYILELLPKETQKLFFSATTEGKTKQLMETFLVDPVSVLLSNNVASNNVHQDIVPVTRNDNKMDLLMDILNKDEVKKVLIFCETKMSVENLYKDLQQHGFDVESIHGDKTQMHRQIALKKFKNNEAWIMIGTDVASRGIDVGDITHVVNYELPRTEEDYIHRIGRTGRGGKIGWALTFVKHQ